MIQKKQMAGRFSIQPFAFCRVRPIFGEWSEGSIHASGVPKCGTHPILLKPLLTTVIGGIAQIV